MAINPLLSAVSAALAQQSTAAPVRPSVSSGAGASADTPDVSDSSPSAPVVQNASLLAASSNFAQLSSLLEVAQSGTEQIGAILQQLQNIADQATGGDSPGLDSEFQQLLSEIDQTAGGTTFGGTPLLDGTLTGTTNTQAPSLSLPNLTTSGLFGSTPLSIATPQDATDALAQIAQAQETVSGTAEDINGIFGQLNFAAASVGSALANGSAAGSTLNEGDLIDGAADDAYAGFLSQPGQATQAQTGNLSNLLSLLQD